MSKKTFSLADSVSMRLIQIFQEAIMTGCDGADLLRLVRLEEDEKNPGVLVQTDDYKKSVKDSHEKLLSRAEELMKQSEQSSAKKLIIDGTN